MLEYELTKEDREAMRPYALAVHVAICTIANSLMGKPDAKPTGIFKYEGGVQTNDHEIAIKDGYVVDDWIHSTSPSPEETAVVTAIHQVRDAFRTQGAQAVCAYKNIGLREDPLRRMLKL